MLPAGSFHKTRLAPTPSGYLHLGNVFSFAITAALAKRSKAGILLRIDDMDRDRANPDYLRDIFDSLRFLNIPWTEGPADLETFEERYSQRHRAGLYQQALDKLRERGLLYACGCSRAKILQNSSNGAYPGACKRKGIPLNTPGVTWRLDTDLAACIQVKTLTGGSVQAGLPEEMRDPVIRKKDGFPAYQLCSVIDDLHFGIDLIVRGQDLWPSTLVQIYIASLLEEPTFSGISFYHHPLLLDDQHRKLSKSAGDTSLYFLRRQGLSAEEIYTRLGKELQLPQTVKHWEDLTPLLPKG